VARLKHEAERNVFERASDLAAGEKAIAVAKSMRDQRNDLVGTLQAIAKLVGLDGAEAWAALCEDPSNVLRPLATVRADLASTQSALRARDAENEAKAAVIAAMELEMAAGKKALSDMVWKAARQIVGEVDNEREAIAAMADAKAEHHAARAEQQSLGGPALHRRAAGSYRALAVAIRARGGKP
jgi:hypothetical protein